MLRRSLDTLRLLCWPALCVCLCALAGLSEMAAVFLFLALVVLWGETTPHTRGNG